MDLRDGLVQCPFQDEFQRLGQRQDLVRWPNRVYDRHFFAIRNRLHAISEWHKLLNSSLNLRPKGFSPINGQSRCLLTN